MTSSSTHPRTPEPASTVIEPDDAISRRRFAGLAGATLAVGLAPALTHVDAATGRGPRVRRRRCRRPRPPHLPAGFNRTFNSRFIGANGIRQHVVIGGDGPPLLLVHGWPENWYAWRLLMPALARDFTVIAVDQRGIGLTEKPRDGYDTGTLARDLASLMDRLGHERFAVVGHDTGYIISYALAADHPERVERLVVAEVPGPPGVGPSPPLFVPEAINNRLWHIPFNRVADDLIEDLVRGREDAFFGYEFRIQRGTKLPDYALRYYVNLIKCDPDALRGSFGFYRAWDATLAQNEQRTNRPLTMPVLGIGGAESWGEAAADGMRPTADDVQTLVIPGAGHWVAEQAPEEMLAALTTFLAPYRDASMAAHTSRRRAAAGSGSRG
jgi:pimeloyl-ACP methyl ester carboxylesterase